MVSQVNQSITFDVITDKVVNHPPFTISANATSGLSVSYSVVSGPATINGDTVTLTGNIGAVTLRARQLGNNQFAPASDVLRSFEVVQGAQTINFASIANKLPPMRLSISMQVLAQDCL